MDIKNQKLKILEEFFNSVGHALVDYYYLEGLDSIDKRQIQNRAMEKIKVADDKAFRLMEDLTVDSKR